MRETTWPRIYRAAAVLAIVCAVLWTSSVAGWSWKASDSGSSEVWIQISDYRDCADIGLRYHVCAEWRNLYGAPAICCIPDSEVGSSNPEACAASLNGVKPRAIE